jgi:hypothetical protein
MNCDQNHQSSRFTAMMIPSKEYPKPMYLFTRYSLTSMSSNMEDNLNYLFGYFYVSETPHENSSAAYYSVEKSAYLNFLTEFSSTRPAGNWTGNVMYLRSHENRKGNASFLAESTIQE